MSMKQILRGAGMIATCVLAVGLTMCYGGGVPICGWLLWYFGALAVVSVIGMGALLHER